jgi:hypothetical protein
MTETILDLGGLLTAYAARSITQSLAPIAAAASLARTINGVLVDLSDPAFRKYASTVSCTDHNAPAFDGVWPGQELVVDCVVELSRLTASPASRPVVPGSERVEGAFTFYRPRLTMRVVSVASDVDETEASVAWQIELEEV